MHNCPAGMYNNYNNSDYSKHDSARDCIICRKANMRAIVVPMNAEIVLRVGIYPTTGMYSFT